MRVGIVLLAALVAACAAPPDDGVSATEAAQTTATVSAASLLEELFDRGSIAKESPGSFGTFMHSSRSPIGPEAPTSSVASFPRCGIELPNPCTRDFNMDFVPATAGETEIDRVELPFGGVLARFFTVIDPGGSPATPRVIRFYVDDDPIPLALVIPNTSNATLPFPFGDPDVPPARSVLGAVTENGVVTHFPIAFAKKLRITSEGAPSSGRLYFQATYRNYREHANITPTPTHGPTLDALAPKARDLSTRFWATPAFGPTVVNAIDASGRGTIRAVRIAVAPDVSEDAVEQARLVVGVNGVTTVDVPLLDFFATSLARDRVRAVVDHETGMVSAQNLSLVRFRGVPFALESRWPIPFENGVRIAVTGLPGTRISVATSTDTSPRTLHATSIDVGANAAHPVVRRVLDLGGAGVYAGTTIAVDNGTDPTWWGEGDELVRVDDVLAIAGTGMEDYFGYGYSSSMTFGGALHAQTVASNRRPGISPASWAGPDTYDNSGRAVNTRAMILDRIPFERRLTFDWELVHTHYLRPFMEGAPPPRVRFDSPYTMRAIHFWYAR